MPRPLPEWTPQDRQNSRFPDWLRKSLKIGQDSSGTESLLKNLRLHSICESARCPNRDECFSAKTATFLILGDVCTRRCLFCSVETGRPLAPDPDEGKKIAEAARKLGLKYVVITSVDRDDLEDEGAAHFAGVIATLKKTLQGIHVEILTPDFRKDQGAAIRTILKEDPEVFGHNLETVRRLFRSIRPQGDYDVSLELLKKVRDISDKVLTKSGLMLGLGETREDVIDALKDLKKAGCRIVTLGQYLRSSSSGLPVKEYIPPQIFLAYKKEAQQMGFARVESGPFVRSSFHAMDSYEAARG